MEDVIKEEKSKENYKRDFQNKGSKRNEDNLDD